MNTVCSFFKEFNLDSLDSAINDYARKHNLDIQNISLTVQHTPESLRSVFYAAVVFRERPKRAHTWHYMGTEGSICSFKCSACRAITTYPLNPNGKVPFPSSHCSYCGTCLSERGSDV